MERLETNGGIEKHDNLIREEVDVTDISPQILEEMSTQDAIETCKSDVKYVMCRSR